MRFESFYPFLLLVAPFAFAHFAEAMVIYFFRMKPFWASVGFSLFINLLTLVVLYGCSVLLGKLGYALSGLQVPPPVMLFFWWLSVVTDGFLLRLVLKKASTNSLFLCSLVMNTISWLFLYFFITNY